MKVVILCGGKGIRAFPFTEYMPKPMLPVGGSPILAQVMRSFISQGFTEFVLATGYRRSVIEDYFDGKDIGATIDILDTGEDTDTGGRLIACRDLVGETFFATYADGLSDVPLERLLSFHKGHPGLATITSVPLITQYGILETEPSGEVVAMEEKPVLREYWINAGFFVFDREVFDHWEGQNLERDVFPNLIKRRLVYTYNHDGFFKSMDNYKDQQEFEDLIRSNDGRMPWSPRQEAE